MTVAELKQINGLQNNNIYAGQKLKVKTSSTNSHQSVETGSGNYTIYIVKSGDSLYSIAKNYPRISDRNIMEFNGLNSSAIKPGMKLKIPSSN
jgi:membrane-bound lytic murein transglycosylase D